MSKLQGVAQQARQVLSDTHQRRLLETAHPARMAAGVAEPHDLGLLLRLWPYLRPQLSWVAVALSVVPVSIFAALQQPLATKRVVDGVVGKDDLLWQSGLWIYAAAVAVQFVAGFAQTYCLQLAGQRAMAALRAKVFGHAYRLRLGFYDRTPVGQVLTRVTNDVDALGELFSSGAIMAIADVLMLVGIVFFMVRLDANLSLVAFAAVPPVALIVELIRRRARVAFRDIRARVAQLNGHLSEQVQGIGVVQAFGREDVGAAEYALINDAYRQANHRAIRYDAMLYSLVEGISSICVAAVLWYGAVRAGLVNEGAGSSLYLGTIAAFYQYIQHFFVPIRDLSTKYTLIQSAMAAAERVFDFLALTELVDEGAPGDRRPDLNARPLIEFDHVDFGYRAGENVLHDVSFSVERGEHVALVGATGAGKSSTISLLAGFYTATGGAVRLGGHDVASLSRHQLRAPIALVSQDVFLFSGTVAENVAMGPVTEANRAKVNSALETVGALELLTSRGGVCAAVEERGGNFSAGERQLIAFARALYRDAEILVLDEATANIDSETEARVQRAMERLMVGRTAIVIAHRLSTIRQADRILVFHRGRIVEQGRHGQLLALGGVYAHLHHLQFGSE